MKYYKHLKSILNDIIVDVSMSSEFVRNPKTDFTRIRKLGFLPTFNSVLTMGGGSLGSEMLELFEYSDSMPCKSAFVQARHKILPEAFSHVFTNSPMSYLDIKLIKGITFYLLMGLH